MGAKLCNPPRGGLFLALSHGEGFYLCSSPPKIMNSGVSSTLAIRAIGVKPVNTNNFQIGTGALLILSSFVAAVIIGKWLPGLAEIATLFLVAAFLIGLGVTVGGVRDLPYSGHGAWVLIVLGSVAALIGYCQNSTGPITP